MAATNHTDLIDKLQRAERTGTPLAAINTPDQPAMEQVIIQTFKDKVIFAWDIVRGLYGRTESACQKLAEIGGQDIQDATKLNPMKALDVAREAFDAGTMLIFHNSQRYLGDAGVVQALINLRDEYKAEQSMVVLIGTGITLPPELASDVMQWTEPLPDDDRLTQIVSEMVTVADEGKQFKKTPDAKAIRHAAVSLRGTSAFGAEQLTAMSLRADGIDVATLYTQAKALIEQTPGLTFEHGKETFDSIGGLGFAKEFGRRLFKGPKAPAVIVRVEELEKAMAGAKGDLSGTSGDALQVLLSQMEDNDWSGMLAYGVPGAGKSLMAKAMANTHGAKGIVFDINSCKGSLVGASEKNIREAMHVIHTLGGDRVFFVASCNAMDTLPAALQRRFRRGVWFFDLPDKTERQTIWAINRKKYGINSDDPTPDEDDLSGADIRNICEAAYELACPLTEARRYVVPLKVQSPQDIQAARAMAKSRFTDASKGGVYGTAAALPAAKGPRKMQVTG